MTSCKIENFFGHLDREQTMEAVAHGASRLALKDLADAVTLHLTRDQIAMLCAEIVTLAAELECDCHEKIGGRA